MKGWKGSLLIRTPLGIFIIKFTCSGAYTSVRTVRACLPENVKGKRIELKDRKQREKSDNNK